MVTFPQYLHGHRKTKKFRSSTPHFEGSPFRYATCVRVGVIKPKKPNSAQRKITKVNLTNGRQLIAKIPGFGHELKKNSEVMVRGGRVRDLPGVHYCVVRGKKDLVTPETKERAQRRSKFGISNPLRQRVTLVRRLANRVSKREERKSNLLPYDNITQELEEEHYTHPTILKLLTKRLSKKLLT